MRAPWEITAEMFLSQAEAAALLTHVRSAEAGAADEARDSALLDRVLIEGLLFSGLRCSEFCSLRVADFRFTRREAAFEVRGARESRTVFLPANVGRLIQDYIRGPRARWAEMGHESDAAPLIRHERGRPYERSGLYRRVVSILSAAGLADRASVQLLRHTYGYHAYLATGGNLLFVQRQLGHSHPGITAIYAQFANESYALLADRVAVFPKARQRSRGGLTGKRKRVVKLGRSNP